MGNSWKNVLPVLITTAVEATPADIYTWKPIHPIRVTDYTALVHVLTAIDGTDAVTTLDHTPSGGSRTEKAVVTITDAVAAGTEVSAAAFDSFVVKPGDTLHFEHKTAGVDAGTEAGDYYVQLWYEIIPDGVV